METTKSREEGKVAVADVQDVALADYSSNGEPTAGIEDEYVGASRRTTFYRSVLFQMILLGA